MKDSLAEGRAALNGWLWPRIATCRHAAPLMVERRAGLIVEITEIAQEHTLEYRGNIFYDLARVSAIRFTYALAEELAPHGVTVLAVAPGFMRTEVVLDHLGATEANWREVAEYSPEARRFGFGGSETPCFVGRAVAALAADPDVTRKSGGLYSSWGLSEEYGFVDVDGGRPHWGRYFSENFSELVNGSPRTSIQWRIARVST